MMRALLVVMTMEAAACGGTGDDCQRFVDKSKPVLQGMGKEMGKTFGDAELTAMVKMCRESAKAKADPVMKCVLDAATEAAVRECYGVAFSDYQAKGRKSEAELQLTKLGKNLKVAYIENAAFPMGKSGPFPAKACCEGPNHKCPVEDWSKDAVWSALDFQIDEPGMFQFTYESDGVTAKATAIGDLDCDGTTVTYTLEAMSKDGDPQYSIIQPTNKD